MSVADGDIQMTILPYPFQRWHILEQKRFQTYFPPPDCNAFKGANFAFKLGLISFLR